MISDEIINAWTPFFAQLPSPYHPLDEGSFKIRFNDRMRSRAGVCYAHRGLIEINPNLIDNIDTLQNVLLHEICHLVVWRRWPRAEPHGVKWKNLMKLCGLKPERCHSLKPEKVFKQRRWKMLCDCREHHVATVVYNKMSKGATYRCRSCRSILRYSDCTTSAPI